MAPMFIFLIPGVIAYSLHNDPTNNFYLLESKATLPELIKYLLPVGVRGLVAAGLLAALMSSLSSVFNSCSTLLTIDIYQKLKPGTDQKTLVRFGQISTIVLVVIGILWIPFQSSLSEGGLFKYIQSIQAYISPPIAAAFLLGIFIKRINASGVMAAFIVGAIFGVFRLSMEFATENLSQAQSNVQKYKDYYDNNFGNKVISIDNNVIEYPQSAKLMSDINDIKKEIRIAKDKKRETINKIKNNELGTLNFRSLESIEADYDRIIKGHLKTIGELSSMTAEKFTDKNENEKWDVDEPFIDKGNGVWDEGEEFTDKNENEKWDVDEPFVDKGNSKFDGPKSYLEKNLNILLRSNFFSEDSFIDCRSADTSIKNSNLDKFHICENSPYWKEEYGNQKWDMNEELQPNFIYKLAKMNFLHFALMLFLICSMVMIGVSLATKAPDYEKIKDLVYSTDSREEKEGQYVSASEFRKSEDKVLSIILVLIVVILWVSFI